MKTRRKLQKKRKRHLIDGEGKRKTGQRMMIGHGIVVVEIVEPVEPGVARHVRQLGHLVL